MSSYFASAQARAGALVAGVLCALSAFSEQTSELGTVEAELNGEAKTWYVHDRGDVPGATWIEQEPGRYTATITGFETRDRRVEGSQLTVSFEFDDGLSEAEHSISGSGRDPADVRLMPSVEDIERLHTLKNGFVHASRIEIGADGAYLFSGTFSGTLTDAGGKVVGELVNGRFEVEGAVQAEPP